MLEGNASVIIILNLKRVVSYDTMVFRHVGKNTSKRNGNTKLMGEIVNWSIQFVCLVDLKYNKVEV